MSRRLGVREGATAAAAVLAAAGAFAFEGAPPFTVVPAGAVVEPYTAEFFVSPGAGAGGGFLHGDAASSLRVRSWAVTAVGFRYGLWGPLEAFGFVPLVWGESPQRYVNVRTGGASEIYSGRLSGFDGGDPGGGLRLRVFRGFEDRLDTTFTAGLLWPLGTNVWQNSANNYVTGPGAPDFASGDGAIKMLLAAEARWTTDTLHASALAGWLYRFSQEATAMEPPASTISVTLPSPVFGWLRAGTPVGDAGWWVGGRVDGYWSARGSVETTGLLARTPESLSALLDSYLNLLSPSGGVWAGPGVRRAMSDTSRFSLEALAPLYARGLYRAWRLEAMLTFGWRPG